MNIAAMIRAEKKRVLSQTIEQRKEREFQEDSRRDAEEEARRRAEIDYALRQSQSEHSVDRPEPSAMLVKLTNNLAKFQRLESQPGAPSDDTEYLPRTKKNIKLR